MKRAIIGSLALSLAAGVVYAQNATPPATSPGQGASSSMEFGTVDANRDGRVSSAEAQSHSALRTEFSKLDADSDNYLSQSEFQKWDKAGKAGASGSSSGAAGSSSSSGAGSSSSGADSSTRSTAPDASSPAPQSNSSSSPAE